MGKVFFIGGPGNISTSAARDVLGNGNELAFFTFPGTDKGEFSGKVKFYYGDRNDPIALNRAINNFGPSVIIDFCCFNLQQAKALYPFIRNRIDQFIFISTVDVYGYPLYNLPMRENDPWNPTNCAYAENKKLVELFYREKQEQEGFPLTIARPAYSMGNSFVLTPLSRSGGRHLIPWLLSGKPVLSVDDGKTLIHASVAANTGQMIACFIGNEKVIGKSYTCGHEFYITMDNYINLFAGALGVKANIAHIPSEFIEKLVDPGLDGYILPVLTKFDLAFSVNAFKNDFPDFKWNVTLEQAAREYIEFNYNRGFFANAQVNILEDLLIEGYRSQPHGFRLPESGYLFYA